MWRTIIRSANDPLCPCSADSVPLNSGNLSRGGTRRHSKSSRDAEREADAYAVAMLIAARIDPIALKHFLEKILKEENKFPGRIFSNLGTVFSTHPVTTERIAQIKPLPAGVALRSPLSDKQWNDLKAICG